MRTGIRSTVFALTTLALFTAAACGSSPKPDPNAVTTSPPEPAEAGTMETAATAATSDAGTGATATADAGGSKEADCKGLQAEAQSELDAELIKVDKVCKKDADCIAVKGRPCGFACTTAAIPKAEEPEWTRELEMVKTNHCKKWGDLECTKLGDGKPPTCRNEGKKPACQAGHCVLK